MSTEQEQRDAVVAEALSFEHTLYHHKGTLKIKRDADGNVTDRGGVDCAWFPFLVYSAVGIIPPQTPETMVEYPPDWYLHRDEERYLKTVETFAKQVKEPRSGDFVLWKIGRLYAHGAIVIDWPLIIHAHRLIGHVTRDEGNGGWLADKDHLFFSVWEK